MKKQKLLLLLLVLISSSLVILTGCKKSLDQSKPTTFSLTFTDRTKGGTFMGYFIAGGGVTTSGNVTMDVTPVGTPGDSIHCSQTLTVPSEGSITILSHCSLINGTGAWIVDHGTGKYSDLQGNGNLVMNSEPEGPVELLRGTTWR